MMMNNKGISYDASNAPQSPQVRSGSANSTTSTPEPTILKRCKSSDKTKTLLPEDFQPGEFNVICGNKRSCFNSAGNKRFRFICKKHLEEFYEAPSKHEKSYVVTKVLRALQEACGSEPVFVAFEKGRWWKVSDRTSREKVGTYFRDSLADNYKSSSKNKIAQRRKKRNQASPSAETMQQSLQQQNSIQFNVPVPASQMETPVPCAPTASASGVAFVPFSRKVSSSPHSSQKTMVTNAIIPPTTSLLDFHEFGHQNDPLSPTPLRTDFPKPSNPGKIMKPLSMSVATNNLLPPLNSNLNFSAVQANGGDDCSIDSSSTNASFYDIVDFTPQTLED